MDVDNGDTGVSGSVDIEQSLLQQFSCMGTTDKDELIQQLQKLLGSPSHLNHSTAAFFLDMNNWNLQAAICSYLDIEAPSTLPSMGLVSDPDTSENENIEPNTRFVKSWHISNTGLEAWPPGCYVQCSDGDSFGGTKVQLPVLQPGEGTHVVIGMNSPSVPGIYQSKWRACTPAGSYFGDPMWTILTVVEQGTIELTEQLSHFNELGAIPPLMPQVPNPFVPHRLHGDSKDSTPPDGMF
ncbi:protein ILRUN [Anthonomus grandis grandis]|uniref:protein ILRUN n=1 Tax=Anthonomus grandis grandis TaxID=2921223 RepID=UPI002165DE13|nr:protein ILRUN [Anthonomus grandis grandis]XP_050308789.1 protein ILRUN [Anthonomus grandis grandis]XP_050308790.1 protein ILRUN [Anthonomus grandis grandis]